ncbi:MAG: hypothetical protein JWP29_2008 [Rhodoferax sp.]|nr:hypothetical protein [Rhodoferax sp.]
MTYQDAINNLCRAGRYNEAAWLALMRLRWPAFFTFECDLKDMP